MRFLTAVLLGWLLLLVPAAAFPPVAIAAQAQAITLQPDCGPAGVPGIAVQSYVITVHGVGFQPGDLVRIDFNGQVVTRVRVGPNQDSFVVTFQVPQQPASAKGYQVVATSTNTGAAAAATFQVPCPPPSPSPSAQPSPSPSATTYSPTLRVLPTVAPPGRVVHVEGKGFPPNAQVQITWSNGIIGPLTDVVGTDGGGGFNKPVLIYYHEQLGRRTVSASVLFSDPPVTPLTADFQVVPGSFQPRNFSWRN